MKARNKKIMPEQIDQAAQEAAAAEATAKAEADAAAAKGGEGEQTPEQIKAAEEATAAADAAKKAEEDNKQPDVRARKTPKDFILERQQKKIQKLEAKKDGEKDGDGESDEDDDIDEEDEKVVKKVLSKTLAPFFEKQIAAEDETEVQEFLANNADFKPYEAKVRTFMKHDSRRSLPISSIFYEVAGPDLLKLGAARAKAADDEARENSAGGGDGGDEEKVSDIDAIKTPEQLATFKANLLEKRRG